MKNYKLNLIVNSKPIPTNKFVTTVFINLLLSLVKTLKGINKNISSVKIELKK